MKTILLIILTLGVLIKITPLSAQNKVSPEASARLTPNENARNFTESIDDPNAFLHKPSDPSQIAAGFSMKPTEGAFADAQINKMPSTSFELCCAKTVLPDSPISLPSASMNTLTHILQDPFTKSDDPKQEK